MQLRVHPKYFVQRKINQKWKHRRGRVVSVWCDSYRGQKALASCKVSNCGITKVYFFCSYLNFQVETPAINQTIVHRSTQPTPYDFFRHTSKITNTHNLIHMLLHYHLHAPYSLFRPLSPSPTFKFPFTLQCLSPNTPINHIHSIRYFQNLSFNK